MPASAFTSTPVNSLLVMTLTTPAKASEPHAADAPPVTMSMRCTSESGIKFISTPPSALDEATRRPLNNTKVRKNPAPLKSTRLDPAWAPEVFLLGERSPMVEENAGILPRYSPSDGGACAMISSAFAMVTGVGAS